MKQTLLSVLVICFSIVASAQKFGHCDGQEILSLMPEMKDVQTQLEAQATELKTFLMAEEAALNTMMEEYDANRETWPAAIEKSKRQAIMNKQQELAEFEQTANKDISDLQKQLLDPLLKKATDAIDAVGKENNFTYIFDTSTGVLLYRGGEDVTPLVKAKLGIL